MSSPGKLPNECVVAVYDSSERAEAAVHALLAAGFTPDHVSVVRRHLDPSGEAARNLSLGDDSLREAAIGSALGGLAGVVGAATMMAAVSGFVLMTGPLAVLTGAIVGAFLGAMKGWGVKDKQIREYEELVDQGKTLVVVAGEPREAKRAEGLLHQTAAEHVRLHAKTGDDDPRIDDRGK
jgi:hypothetical protein